MPRLLYMYLFLIQLEHSHKSFGRQLNGTQGTHFFLPFPHGGAMWAPRRGLECSGEVNPPCAILRFAANSRRKRRPAVRGPGRQEKMRVIPHPA